MAVGKSGVIIERPRSETRHAGKSHDDNLDGRGETYVGDDNEMQKSDEQRRKEAGNERLAQQKQEAARGVEQLF